MGTITILTGNIVLKHAEMGEHLFSPLSVMSVKL